MKMTFVSPSQLKDFESCPRCFWISRVAKIKAPSGIFPSLPGGMDRRLKDYFDTFRAKGEVPPEAKVAHIEVLVKQEKIDLWRDWRKTDLAYIDEKTGIRVSGALDECGITGDDLYEVIDYKTRGYPLKEDPALYYQTQMNIYDLMLNHSGLRTTGRACLIFYYPIVYSTLVSAGADIGGICKFKNEVVELTADKKAATELIAQVADCFKLQKPPKSNPKCQVCNYITETDSLRG